MPERLEQEVPLHVVDSRAQCLAMAITRNHQSLLSSEISVTCQCGVK